MASLPAALYLVLIELVVGGLVFTVLLDLHGRVTRGFLGLSGLSYWLGLLLALWARAGLRLPAASGRCLGLPRAGGLAVSAVLAFSLPIRAARAGLRSPAAGDRRGSEPGGHPRAGRRDHALTVLRVGRRCGLAHLGAGAVTFGAVMTAMILAHGIGGAQPELRPLWLLTDVVLAGLVLQALLSSAGPRRASGRRRLPVRRCRHPQQRSAGSDAILVGLLLPLSLAGVTW